MYTYQDEELCTPLRFMRRFGGTRFFHLQDGRRNQAKNVMEQISIIALQDDSLLGLLFYPDDGSGMFLRNVLFETDYTALHDGRFYSL
jgi:hypothetical protein